MPKGSIRKLFAAPPPTLEELMSSTENTPLVRKELTKRKHDAEVQAEPENKKLKPSSNSTQIVNNHAPIKIASPTSLNKRTLEEVVNKKTQKNGSDRRELKPNANSVESSSSKQVKANADPQSLKSSLNPMEENNQKSTKEIDSLHQDLNLIAIPSVDLKRKEVNIDHQVQRPANKKLKRSSIYVPTTTRRKYLPITPTEINQSIFSSPSSSPTMQRKTSPSSSSTAPQAMQRKTSPSSSSTAPQAMQRKTSPSSLPVTPQTMQINTGPSTSSTAPQAIQRKTSTASSSTAPQAMQPSNISLPASPNASAWSVSPVENKKAGLAPIVSETKEGLQFIDSILSGMDKRPSHHPEDKDANIRSDQNPHIKVTFSSATSSSRPISPYLNASLSKAPLQLSVPLPIQPVIFATAVSGGPSTVQSTTQLPLSSTVYNTPAFTANSAYSSPPTTQILSKKEKNKADKKRKRKNKKERAKIATLQHNDAHHKKMDNLDFGALLKQHENAEKSKQASPVHRPSPAHKPSHKPVAAYKGPSDNKRPEHNKNKKFIPKLICNYFIRGNCKAGDKCTFKHEGEQIPPPTMNIICQFYKTGSCTAGEDCNFSHNLNLEPCRFYHMQGTCELQNCPYSHEPLNEDRLNRLRQLTGPCRFYNFKGYCNTGDQCLFSHDQVSEEEKRKVELTITACRYYHLKGSCRSGDECFYLHQEASPEQIKSLEPFKK